MRWGLVPRWCSKPLKELRAATFNARRHPKKPNMKIALYIKALAELADRRIAEGGRFVWHRWFAWHQIRTADEHQPLFLEWCWRARSANDEVWHYKRVTDWPYGGDSCPACGVPAGHPRSLTDVNQEKCLAEPDLARMLSRLWFFIEE